MMLMYHDWSFTGGQGMNRGYVLRRIAAALGAKAETTRFDAELPRDNVMEAGNTGAMVLRSGEDGRRSKQCTTIEHAAMLEAEARMLCLQIDPFWTPRNDEAITIEDLGTLEEMLNSMLLTEVPAEQYNLSRGALEDLQAICEELERYDDECPKLDVRRIAITFDELRSELWTDIN